MSIFDYQTAVISRRRKGTPDDPYIDISESQQIVKNKAILSEIPDEFTKVIVSGLGVTWIETTSIPTENQYKVDYDNGYVEFYSSRNGENLTFTYKGTGVYYINAQRVFISVNESGEVTQTLDQLVNETNNNEQTRQENELTRESNELIRQENENTREQNEITRESNEDLRESAEIIRESNENERIDLENIREQSETTRELNEITRQENEDIRISSENTRITTEDNRISAETIRENNETTRKSNETLRQTNEQTRVNAENIRITNENERISNEINRDLGYQNMLDSSKFILKQSVETFNDIATTYTDPANGWAVRVQDTGKLYRYNGQDWIWVDTITATVFDSLVTAPKYFWIEEKTIQINGNTFTVVNDILPEQEIRIIDLKYGVEWLENIHWTRIGKVFTFTSNMPEVLTFRITNLG